MQTYKRSKIVVVGKVENGIPIGFCFDGGDSVDTAISFEDDEQRWGGWTISELLEVIQRPNEFLV